MEGSARFLEANTRAKVYLREAPLAGRHFRAFAVLDRAIGLDLEVVEQNQDRFEFVGGTHEIAPQVFSRDRDRLGPPAAPRQPQTLRAAGHRLLPTIPSTTSS